MTLMVTVDPARFALTTTPSIGPSACDETMPVNAGPDWADTSTAVKIPREIVTRLLRTTSALLDGPHHIIPGTGYKALGLEVVMRKFAWLLFCGGIVGLSLSLQAQQAGADLILTNGKIITVNDTFQIAQAVAVKGARIIAVGSNADITK